MISQSNVVNIVVKESTTKHTLQYAVVAIPNMRIRGGITLFIEPQ